MYMRDIINQYDASYIHDCVFLVGALVAISMAFSHAIK